MPYVVTWWALTLVPVTMDTEEADSNVSVSYAIHLTIRIIFELYNLNILPITLYGIVNALFSNNRYRRMPGTTYNMRR